MTDCGCIEIIQVPEPIENPICDCIENAAQEATVNDEKSVQIDEEVQSLGITEEYKDESQSAVESTTESSEVKTSTIEELDDTTKPGAQQEGTWKDEKRVQIEEEVQSSGTTGESQPAVESTTESLEAETSTIDPTKLGEQQERTWKDEKRVQIEGEVQSYGSTRESKDVSQSAVESTTEATEVKTSTADKIDDIDKSQTDDDKTCECGHLVEDDKDQLPESLLPGKISGSSGKPSIIPDDGSCKCGPPTDDDERGDGSCMCDAPVEKFVREHLPESPQTSDSSPAKDATLDDGSCKCGPPVNDDGSCNCGPPVDGDERGDGSCTCDTPVKKVGDQLPEASQSRDSSQRKSTTPGDRACMCGPPVDDDERGDGSCMCDTAVQITDRAQLLESAQPCDSDQLNKGGKSPIETLTDTANIKSCNCNPQIVIPVDFTGGCSTIIILQGPKCQAGGNFNVKPIVLQCANQENRNTNTLPK